ncbi:MAG: fibronectin type III domain-containing protein [Lachnospiraceae bacterium]|nr:fibronectin type III domain-containing protein [Lachnospiraceae bacterium]
MKKIVLKRVACAFLALVMVFATIIVQPQVTKATETSASMVDLSFSFKVENVDKGIKLSWNKCTASACDGYIISKVEFKDILGNSASISYITSKGELCLDDYDLDDDDESLGDLIPISKTSYLDTNVKTNYYYTYYVVPMTDDGEAITTPQTGVLANGGIFDIAPYTVYRFKTPSLSMKKASKGFKLTWSKVTGAEHYVLYRKTNSGSYKKIKTLSSKTTSYTDTTATSSSAKYYYYVKATASEIIEDYEGDVVYSFKFASAASPVAANKSVSAPKLKSVVNTSSGVKLTWAKASGATSYVIYRKLSSGEYKKIGTVNGNSTVTYTDKTAKNGKTYTYYVKSYNGYKTKNSNTKKIVFVSSTKISAVSSPSSKTIKATWSKISGVTGYQIQYSTNKSFENAKTVKVSGASTVSKTIKSLTGNKTYYVRVRAYKKVGKTNYYAGWSSVKKIKTKA